MGQRLCTGGVEQDSGLSGYPLCRYSWVNSVRIPYPIESRQRQADVDPCAILLPNAESPLARSPSEPEHLGDAGQEVELMLRHLKE